MDLSIDHYKMIGLPSGDEGSKLTINEIKRAYKQKALILHPDKNPDNPNAHSNFMQLKTSYEVLKFETSRKQFDDALRLTAARERQRDAKRRRLASDLAQRERAWHSTAAKAEAKASEDAILKKLDDEVSTIRAKNRKLNAAAKSNVVVETTSDFTNTPIVFPLHPDEHQSFEDSVLQKLKKKAAQKPN